MKSLLKTSVILFSAAFLLFACESSFDSLVDQRLENNPEPDPVSGDPGNADFSNYVAIGSSITAGYMDGALYNLGQQYSLGALLADRLSFAGAPGNFNQPDINSELGFNTTVPNPRNGTILGRYKLDTDIPGPSPTLGGDAIGPYQGNTADLDNFAIPGAVIGQLLIAETGGPSTDPAFNPFYARFASSPGSSTLLGDVISAGPTFASIWIGSNDVLGYAVGGAANPALLTSAQDFENRFNAMVGQLLTNTETQGVVVTIPAISVLPYFRAVPFNAVTLESAEAQQLNQAFAGLNGGLEALAQNGLQPEDDVDRRKVSYSEGANPILVNDPELDDLQEEFDQLESSGAITTEQRQALVPYEQSRPLTSDELVTLAAGSLLGTEANPGSPSPTTIGVVVPLGLNSAASGDEYYLTAAEQLEIRNRTTAFNTTLATAVAGNSDRLALYDINSGLPGNPNTEIGAFADLFGFDGELGINIQGTELLPDFSPNGVFSTDGIHPNVRGNAILANEIIRVIEQAFGAEIPRVDVLNLPSVQLCAGNCLSQQPS